MKYFALLLLVFASPLMACCMVPSDYKGDVDQSAQRVVILHRAPDGDTPGYEEMIIRVEPFFQGAEGNPTGMTWVVTVPNKPSRYDMADPAALEAGGKLHDKLFQLARQQWADKTGFEVPSWLTVTSSAPADGMKTASLELDPAVNVGPYTITPVRAVGAEAVDALNDYLGKRGFPKEDPKHLQYFIDNDFTFLCISVAPAPGAASLPATLEMPPLLIGFESANPYYPGRFSSRQGNFALDLTVITDQPLETRNYAEMRHRLNAKSFGYVQLVNLYTVKALPDELAGALSERITKRDKQHWYVNRIVSDGFNESPEEGIAKWPEDVFFKAGTYEDELPGFWYYGDQEVSWLERMAREHTMLLFVGMGVLFFGSMIVKVRINRKRHLAANRG